MMRFQKKIFHIVIGILVTFTFVTAEIIPLGNQIVKIVEAASLPVPYTPPKGSNKAVYLSGLDLSKKSGTYYTTTKEEYIQTSRFNLYLDKGVEVPVNVIQLINHMMDAIEDTTGYKFYIQHYNSDKFYSGMNYELEQYFETAEVLKKVDSKDERLDIVVAYSDIEVGAYSMSLGGIFLNPEYIKLIDGSGDALLHELLHVVYYQNGSSMGSHMDEGFTTYYTTLICNKDKKVNGNYDGFEALKNYQNVISESNIEELFINYTAGQSRYQLGFRLIDFIYEEYGVDAYKKLHQKVTKVSNKNYNPPMRTIAAAFKSELGEDLFKAFARWHSNNMNRYGDEDITVYGDWKIELFGNYGYLQKYYGDDVNVIIPNTVCDIQPEAFMECSTMVNVSIPTTVTSIGGGAFFDCTKLIKINIPDSVTDISTNVFEGCISLKKVVLPKGIKKIAMSTFYGCTSLTDITILEGVSTIENAAFSNCTSLSAIKLPSTLEKINSYVFNNCGLDSIVIPDSVTALEEGVFQDCSKLKTVKLPKGLKEIKNFTFNGCESLKTIKLPEGLTSIGYSAFNFTGLSKISIPSSVTSIGDYAFANCKLSSIVIPKSVKNMGKEAFYNNPKLTIYGDKGSYAETYAKEHLIKFAVKK